ncbi:hypothetical protein [Bifidobacterium vespertilionis]|uniref:Uncharacterized protein n=1 Tax=Bifidobacterium vespertilionis TaxID=2562524 RepID=A0A5J5DW10_9BIFI|nr:hypothetical protein [Bifidobacterium vespertilionis]KAA8815719.1 hypothetical protein EMO90_11805 [Bifidobacterium vespertilionis]KAA8821021.1 hypothetical protein EM848_11565 [Bifidobacterium vespertilionis]
MDEQAQESRTAKTRRTRSNETIRRDRLVGNLTRKDDELRRRKESDARDLARDLFKAQSMVQELRERVARFSADYGVPRDVMAENLELEKSDARFYLKKPVKTVEEEPQPASVEVLSSTDVTEAGGEASSDVSVETGVSSGNESMDTPDDVPGASLFQTSLDETSYMPVQSRVW